MRNKFIMQRLQGIIDSLKSVHTGGQEISNCTKGTERELFVNQVLNNIIAPPFRIGTGDITDSQENKSGQCDIIIEYSNSISFPNILPSAPRLYLAEGVCAVIEIKSNLKDQWAQVVDSSSKVAKLRGSFKNGIFSDGLNMNIGCGVTDLSIPYFVVAYQGWTEIKTVRDHLNNNSHIMGILILNPVMYCERMHCETGLQALFSFFTTVQNLTGKMIASTPNYDAYL